MYEVVVSWFLNEKHSNITDGTGSRWKQRQHAQLLVMSATKR